MYSKLRFILILVYRACRLMIGSGSDTRRIVLKVAMIPAKPKERLIGITRLADVWTTHIVDRHDPVAKMDQNKRGREGRIRITLSNQPAARR